VDINCGAGMVFGGVLSGTAEIIDSYALAGGSLTRVQGSPLNSTAAKGSNSVVLSPDDAHLFVSNQMSASVTAFSVASTGVLTMVGTPFSIGAGYPAGMAIDQTGSTLYVADSSNQIYVLNVAADGSLTMAAGSPATTNQSGGVLSLAAYPGKTCPVLGGGGGTPPPPPPPPPPSDPLTVNIQIMADNGNSTNAAITPQGRTLVRVAILSSSNPSFNAPSQVDMTSLTFGHSGTEKSLAFCDTTMQDVNHDGLPDLVCHFYAAETGFVHTDTMGILGGKLRTGTQAIQGSASVKIAN
jgi:hypothetical protein